MTVLNSCVSKFIKYGIFFKNEEEENNSKMKIKKWKTLSNNAKELKIKIRILSYPVVLRYVFV